jgi:hypothetical protein
MLDLGTDVIAHARAREVPVYPIEAMDPRKAIVEPDVPTDPADPLDTTA